MSLRGRNDRCEVLILNRKAVEQGLRSEQGSQFSDIPSVQVDVDNKAVSKI